ncbi:hypothetical protein U9M48_007159 [Paspalum notatum var. saurae]|uniref:Uncharacterized protein n=1 Tax=Paspalum notatum var. saurae TaxID=547442 RepID=A0AAQ3PTY3_PASNO
MSSRKPRVSEVKSNGLEQWLTQCGSMGEVQEWVRMQRSGGGATRFKEHLAHRGNDAKDCPSVPAEVKKFFIEQLDKNKERARARARDKLLRDAAARAPHIDLDPEEEEGHGQGQFDEDAAMQAALRQSREEYNFMQRAGPHYERGGGSGIYIYIYAEAAVFAGVGRTSRELIGRAWAKACHAIGIPGRKVDDPYFKAAIMETQKQGVGIKIPSVREIDGKYLDENVKEIEKEIEKWKMEWDELDYGL